MLQSVSNSKLTMSSKIILNLQQADSLESEYKVLLEMKDIILAKTETASNASDQEESLTQLDGSESCLKMFLLSEESLQIFLSHLFGRRFGWSEPRESLKQGEADKKSSLDTNLRLKGQINGVIDGIINLLMNEKVSLNLLNGFKYAILNAHDKPVVRKHTIIHLLNWLKHSEMEFTHDKFLLIKEIIIAGLTDIWSVIRNSCVVNLNHVIELFTVQQLEDFFTALVMICSDLDQGWQAREGAIMGISCVIRRFRWISISDEKPHHEILKPKAECIQKSGKEETRTMPMFIQDQLLPLVYRLLSDTQLTIREHAIKAYSLYISRSDVQEMMSSFYATILQLCPDQTPLQQKLSCDSSESASLDKVQSAPHHLAVLESGFKFLDAPLAEGLLGLCVHLVKHFPPSDLLSNWSNYFSAFNLYMMHPASTVRQATSVIFKFIVAKNSSNPVVLKLVLRSLIASWSPDLSHLSRDRSHSHADKGLSASRISVTDLGKLTEKNESVFSLVWQWREGRLLTYELIFQFLIKNHWLYTFGSAYQSEVDAVAPSIDDTQQTSHSLHYSFSEKDSELLKKRAKVIANNEASTGKSVQFSEYPESRNFASQRRSQLSHRYSISSTRTTDAEEAIDTRSSNYSIKKAAKRRESVSSYDAASLRVLGRHCACRRGSNSRHMQGLPSADNASLLLRCFREDSSLISSDHIAEESLNGTPLASGSPDGDLLQANDLRSFLRVVLFQCIESLVDDQWELRRMGHQLLPCTVEVIRWYDISLLTNLCDTYFNGETTLFNFGLGQAVKYSMSHAADLIAMLRCSTHLWQDSSLCQNIVMNITEAILQKIPRWCSVAEMLIGRPVIDKITLVSVEILMTDLIHFDSRKESAKEIQCVLNALISVFCEANSETELAKSLIHSEWYTQRTVISHNGFLSCCAKEETELNTFASQVEKAFLSNIQTHLPLFCDRIDVKEIVVLLPVLAFYLLKYTEDDGISKAVSESITTASLSVGRMPLDESSDIISRDAVKRSLNSLLVLITHKQVDQTSLQNAVSLYYNLMFSFTLTEADVSSLLQSVLTRLNKMEVKPVLATQGKSCVAFSDLKLLSNDIPLPPSELVALQANDDEDDEDDDVLDHSNPRVMWETQVIGGSGGGTIGLSPRGGVVISNASLNASNGIVCRQHSEVSDDSDWDNWSQEDEEDNSEVTVILLRFLHEIEDNFRSKGLEPLLQQSIRLLSDAEKSQMKSCFGCSIKPN